MRTGKDNYLVQILLPLADNRGRPLPWKLYKEIQKELTERFKGLTAYSRAPAEGLWKPRRGTKRDEIVVYEVMTPTLDRIWWKRYRRRLEEILRQETIVIRAQKMETL
jgi:hypothetical protein